MTLHVEEMPEEFDFAAHGLTVVKRNGPSVSVEEARRRVAEFYAKYPETRRPPADGMGVVELLHRDRDDRH